MTQVRAVLCLILCQYILLLVLTVCEVLAMHIRGMKCLECIVFNLLPLTDMVISFNAQIENEYGLFSKVICGVDYMLHLRDLFRSYLGDDIVFMTTDPPTEQNFKCGAVNGSLATADFGPGGSECLRIEASYD